MSSETDTHSADTELEARILSFPAAGLPSTPIDNTEFSKSAYKRVKSSWIDTIAYRNGYFALFIKYAKHDKDESIVALLYSNIPYFFYEKIVSSLSPGTEYSRLIRNKDVQESLDIKYQRVVGKRNVNELKKLMGVK